MKLLDPFKKINKENSVDWKRSFGQYFVVFSDIHVSKKRKSQQSRALDLMRNVTEDWDKNIKRYLSDDKFRGILLVGDITHTGCSEEFELFNELYLKAIMQIFNATKEEVFAVPGNHDLNRTVLSKSYYSHKKEHPVKIKDYYKRIEFGSNEGNIWNKSNNNRFKSYDEWLKKTTTITSRDNMVAGPWGKTLNGENKPITIAGINSAIASSGFVPRKCIEGCLNLFGRSHPKNHWVSSSQIYAALGEKKSENTTLLMMHHSLDDFDSIETGSSICALNELADIYLHGHHHVLNAEDKSEISPIRISAPSFGNPNVKKNSKSNVNHRDSYAIIRIEGNELQIFYRTNLPPQIDSKYGFQGKNGASFVPDYCFNIKKDNLGGQ